MKKINTFLLVLIFATGIAVSQKVNVGVYKVNTAPVLDGVEDELWNSIQPVTFNKPLVGDLPTPSEGTFKAVYNDTALFVLVTYADDDHFPFYEKDGSSGFENYNMDHIEIYTDVNSVLNDGKGPNDANSGNYSVDPGFDVDKEGQIVFGGGWSGHTANRYSAYKRNGEGYTMEIAIPFQDNLITVDGLDFVPANGAVMGFDVVVVDRDEFSGLGRQRVMWQNDNSEGLGDPWMNMDACGTLTFSGVINGNQDIKSLNGINIFPNPVTDYLKVNGDFTKAIIFDITGQKVMQGSTNEFNLSNLNNGMYIVNLYNKGEFIGSSRFIKK